MIGANGPADLPTAKVGIDGTKCKIGCSREIERAVPRCIAGPNKRNGPEPVKYLQDFEPRCGERLALAIGFLLEIVRACRLIDTAQNQDLTIRVSVHRADQVEQFQEYLPASLTIRHWSGERKNTQLPLAHKSEIPISRENGVQLNFLATNNQMVTRISFIAPLNNYRDVTRLCRRTNADQQLQ